MTCRESACSRRGSSGSLGSSCLSLLAIQFLLVTLTGKAEGKRVSDIGIVKYLPKSLKKINRHVVHDLAFTSFVVLIIIVPQSLVRRSDFHNTGNEDDIDPKG